MPGFEGISRATFPGFPITLKSCETPPTWGQAQSLSFVVFFKTSGIQTFGWKEIFVGPLLLKAGPGLFNAAQKSGSPPHC